jgi:predicted peptidase
MGGYGTFMMGLTYSNFFAGIAPVAGGGMSWRAAKLRTTPVFAYHGDKDDCVPLVYSELMTNVLKANGGRVELRVLEGYGHCDGIDCAYENTDLIEKLFSCRRTDFARVPEICEEMF